MSDEKYTEDDPERTLITLDQLSQTIEVMTSVVNRLRQHLSEQLKAQIADQQAATEPPAEPSEPELAEPAQEQTPQTAASESKESFVVEISQPESEPVRKNNKTLH